MKKILKTLAILSFSIGTSLGGTFVDAQSTGTTCVDIPVNLSVGASGTEVIKLQNFLISRGGNNLLLDVNGNASGIYGNVTAQAVRDYQARSGITPSAVGSTGPLTRALIAKDTGCASLRVEDLREGNRSVRIISPNEEGIVWVKGQAARIHYIGENIGGHTISAWMQEATTSTSIVPRTIIIGQGQTVNNGNNNRGSIGFTVPLSARDGNYKIVVSARTSPTGTIGITDESDALITVRGSDRAVRDNLPTITIKKPLGNDIWFKNQDQKVEWDKVGGEKLPLSLVFIDLITLKRYPYPNSERNDGSLNLRSRGFLKTLPDGTYKLRLLSFLGNGQGVMGQSEPFEIKTAADATRLPAVSTITQSGDFSLVSGRETTIRGGNFLESNNSVILIKDGVIEAKVEGLIGRTNGSRLSFLLPSIPSGLYQITVENRNGTSNITNSLVTGSDISQPRSVTIEKNIVYNFRLPRSYKPQDLGLYSQSGISVFKGGSQDDADQISSVYYNGSEIEYKKYYFKTTSTEGGIGWREIGKSSIEASVMPTEFVSLRKTSGEPVAWTPPAGTIYYGKGLVSTDRVRWLNDFKAAYPVSTTQNLSTTLSTNKSQYTQNEVITLTATVRNQGNTPVTLTFPNGCPPLAYTIGNFTYSPSTQICPSVVITEIVPANGTKTFTNTHTLSANPIAAGNYTIVGGVKGAGTGSANITIISQSATLPTVPAKPTITSLSSNNGKRGDVITIKGTGFRNIDELVVLGSLPIRDVFVNSTEVTFTVPSTATLGTKNLLIQNSGGRSNILTFTVNDTPVPPNPNIPLTLSLTATPSNVTTGGSTDITWQSTGASLCAKSGDWSNITSGTASSGTLKLQNLNSTKTYKMTCYGLGLFTSVDKEVVVTVNDIVRSVSIDESRIPTEWIRNENVVVYWSSIGIGTNQQVRFSLVKGDIEYPLGNLSGVHRIPNDGGSWIKVKSLSTNPLTEGVYTLKVSATINGTTYTDVGGTVNVKNPPIRILPTSNVDQTSQFASL